MATSKAAAKSAARKKPHKGAVLAAEAKAKGEVGRPTKYDPSMDVRATKLCMLGLTNEELAISFGVNASTICDWIRDIPSFSNAIYAGREGADAEIAASLYHRAKGYSHPEDDIKAVALGNNLGSKIVITKTVKHYPPDTYAGELWLRNRRRHSWCKDPEAPGGGGGLDEAAKAAQEAIAAALDDSAPPKED